MNRIDFTQPGGFPLDQDVFGFLQLNINMAAQLASILGPFAIVNGCEQNGTNIGNGYVVINNEILPFAGGAIQAKVIIRQNATMLNYEDGQQRPSQIERYATFGDDGATNILWANFKRNTSIGILSRLEALESLPERVAAIEKYLAGFQPWLKNDIKEIDCTLEYMNANFDASGLGKNERLGWAICNGNNGTRNRQGRVAVQYSPYEFEFSYMGQVSGEKAVSLTTEQMPAHRHAPGSNFGKGNGLSSSGGVAVDRAGSGGGYSAAEWTASEGGNQSHNNLQPYIVTLFIQKIA